MKEIDLGANVKLRDDWGGDYAVRELREVGAVAVPLLTTGLRAILLANALSREYEKLPPYTRLRTRKEALRNREKLSALSPFGQLAPYLDELLTRKLEEGTTDPFASPLEINRFSLQIYYPGMFGVGPHLDNHVLQNLVVVLVLAGRAEFVVCKDKYGEAIKVICAEPGDGILMRARGFLGNPDGRVFHGLRNITELRVIAVGRQGNSTNLG